MRKADERGTQGTIHKGSLAYPGEEGLEKLIKSGHLLLFSMKFYYLSRTLGGEGGLKNPILAGRSYGWPSASLDVSLYSRTKISCLVTQGSGVQSQCSTHFGIMCLKTSSSGQPKP